MSTVPEAWVVHVDWRATDLAGPGSTASPYENQVDAERSGLSLACCNGSRYVTVLGPGLVVTLDWDAYTNKARRYGRYLGPCTNLIEPTGTPCTGELYAAPHQVVQVRCPECGAWTGVQSPGVRHPF